MVCYCDGSCVDVELSVKEDWKKELFVVLKFYFT